MKQILFLLTVWTVLFDSNAIGQNASWNDNVACILYTRCTSCHHDGGIAPFPLMTYDDASAAAYGMQQSVNSGSMPPWPPDESYRSFAHERVLTQEEIDIINDWVDNGMPVGAGVPPMPPVYQAGEEMVNPDLVLTMPSYTINTLGNDVYRCFVLPTGLNEDVYIREIEVVPGNNEAVHHALIYQDNTGVPQQLDANDPGPGYTSFGGTGSTQSKLIGAWTPGQGLKVYPAGMGVPVPAGANIIIQVHYPTTANGQTDQTKINIKYTTQQMRSISIAAALSYFDLNEGPLVIPANTQPTFTCDYTLPQQGNITVLDVFPHMHLLGKSIKVWATTPLGAEIPIVDIPEWDFHWQGFYDFRQPLTLPGGSTLSSSATYDNTTGNPNNPNNPPQTVTGGEATDEEMMLVYFSYLLSQPGDEDIVIDTSTVVQTHNNCDYQSAVDIEETEGSMKHSVYPNPSNGLLHFQLNGMGQATLTVFDATGRIVHSSVLHNAPTDISRLPNGVYHAEIETDMGKSVHRIVLSK